MILLLMQNQGTNGKKKVLPQQSFFDLALELDGNIENALDLLDKVPSAESITAIPPFGQIINFTEKNEFNTLYYKQKKITPASSDYSTLDQESGYSPDYEPTQYGVEFEV